MMRDSIQAEEVLKRSHAIGQYYGFTPFAMAAAKMRGTMPSGRVQHPPELETMAFDPVAESVVSFLKKCRESGLAPQPRQPMFLWHSNIASGRPAPKASVVQFHAIGADRAIADAVIIRALRALVQDLFKEESVIRINTLGDKETRARFARELSNFFKKRGDTLPEECMACAKRDPFEAAEYLISRANGADLPSSTDHLSDQSRKRFEELLEYLEMTETPYELAPDLISRGMVWSETCFEMKVGDKVVAWGSRYGDLAKLMFKSNIPAAVAVLRIPTMGAKIPIVKPRARLRFAFVHIGEEAKRVSIRLAEELRHAHIPLEQAIGVESLVEQMHFVEAANPPYLLIMGRKEALEGSAVLRNRETQEETIIPLSLLTEKLKAFA